MLRDAWEGMVTRDIATAGGVDPKQVRPSRTGNKTEYLAVRTGSTAKKAACSFRTHRLYCFAVVREDLPARRALLSPFPTAPA